MPVLGMPVLGMPVLGMPTLQTPALGILSILRCDIAPQQNIGAIQK
jgi:hypothetical protein